MTDDTAAQIRRAYKRMADAGHRPAIGTDHCRCKIQHEADRYAKAWATKPNTQPFDVYLTEAGYLHATGNHRLARAMLHLADTELTPDP